MDPIKTLVDSGSSKNFINITFTRKHSLPLIELQHQRAVIGIDGNKTQERVRFQTSLTLEVEGRTFKQRFYAMPLGDTTLILGNPWLTEADPDISWNEFKIRYRDEGREESQDITGKTASEAPIPEEFRGFADVFDAELFKELPPHREHDCAIKFKTDTKLPKPAKTYPMSPAESKALTEYLDTELTDGKIRPSKSPIAAPCFYVKKSDGSLRLVVDY